MGGRGGGGLHKKIFYGFLNSSNAKHRNILTSYPKYLKNVKKYCWKILALHVFYTIFNYMLMQYVFGLPNFKF